MGDSLSYLDNLLDQAYSVSNFPLSNRQDFEEYLPIMTARYESNERSREGRPK